MSQAISKLIIQFTGLSGSGKSTLCAIVKDRLTLTGYTVDILDGDEIRKKQSAGLGFGKEDRLTHLRQVAQMANDSHADMVLLAVVNPYEESRQYFRTHCGAHLIGLKCTLTVLKERDTKGLYRRAFLPDQHPDKLTNLTGVNDPYDEPTDADLLLDTAQDTVEKCASDLLDYILRINNERIKR